MLASNLQPPISNIFQSYWKWHDWRKYQELTFNSKGYLYCVKNNIYIWIQCQCQCRCRNFQLTHLKAFFWKLAVKELLLLLHRYFQAFYPVFKYTFILEQLWMTIPVTSWCLFLYINRCSIRVRLSKYFLQ